MSKPKLYVKPRSGLVDEKVHIRVSGLKPFETVKLSAELSENEVVFQSHAMYTADCDGHIDLVKDAAQSGTYTGVEPMGLFWSMSAPKNQKLIKKNIEIPWKVKISVSPSQEEGPTPYDTSVLERSYMKSNIRRIPVKDGPFRGSIFIPEGDGPFPALIDLAGAIVSLVETRGALLASHGFTTFCLSYMWIDHLSKTIPKIDPKYILDAFDWYSQQPYVAKDRMGLVGLCLGGTLAVLTTAREPRVKALVNFSGIPIDAIDIQKEMQSQDFKRLRPNSIEETEEGIVMKECSPLDGNTVIPAWQHGAKILIITGGDDLMINQDFNFKFIKDCPDKYKKNVEHVHFPGAGHYIEPPYTPHCRVLDPKDRLPSFGFIPEKFWDKHVVMGGEPVQHAKAQEFGWEKCIAFLKKTLIKMYAAKY